MFSDDNEKPGVSEGLLHSIIRESLAVNFGDVGWAQVGGSLNSVSDLDNGIPGTC